MFVSIDQYQVYDRIVMSLIKGVLIFWLFLPPTISRFLQKKNAFRDDICDNINGQRIYLEYGETGTLVAKYRNNTDGENAKMRLTKPGQERCTVEFVSCPSCIVQIKFKFLNVSRNCGRTTVFDSCGCDYVWIYEPPFEQSSGEQFCGRFIDNNVSLLEYHSQTRRVAVVFLYTSNYKHAFTLEYSSRRNRIVLSGSPRFGNLNNASQIVTSPFFPTAYPSDLNMEHVIRCQVKEDTCRISLVFTDFLIDSSIIDIFDWNNERIFVSRGNIFRPPILISSGPALSIKFYANGASDIGFKAHYTYILNQLNDNNSLKPDIDCGGVVRNLGGGITMMNMVSEGSKYFDCIWIIKPPETNMHRKSHIYVKVVEFLDFATGSELIIRQGFTSNGPLVESLKMSPSKNQVTPGKEHVVTLGQGFYLSLKGLFRPESRLVVIYAAFNYKDCLAGSDFLCRNLRCISGLLSCDGFDHCGDNSDEFKINCSKDPRDRRMWSNTSHFLFPKNDDFTDLTISTVAFLLCGFGLVALVVTIVAFLYRVNLKSRHQMRLQDHLETINAILEESIGEIVEEIIIPDEPPDYEAPPDYKDIVINSKPAKKVLKREKATLSVQGTSRSCQTTPVRIPKSPPPQYFESKKPKKLLAKQLFNDLRLSFGKRSRHCMCKSFRKNNSRLVCCPDYENNVKCVSESELNCFQNDFYSQSDSSNYFKISFSFTTDDINSFL